MATVILLAIQSAALLCAVALGAWLTLKLRNGKHATVSETPASPAPTHSPLPDITSMLPSPRSAELHDVQQGLTHLSHILGRLESGSARPQEYAEAKSLAQWTLDAGKAAEERLARQIGLGEHGDGRMDADTARAVVERCQAEGVPQRAIARITGWSKSWVASQCLAGREAEKTELVGS